jgi:hypothetical protein
VKRGIIHCVRPISYNQTPYPIKTYGKQQAKEMHVNLEIRKRKFG